MKNQKVLLGATLVALSMIMIPELVNAEIFKCVNTKGATYYNDKPCPRSNEETKIRGVKDPKGGFIPPLRTTKLEKKTMDSAHTSNGSDATSMNSGSIQDKVENRQVSTKSSGSSGKSASAKSNASKSQASTGLSNEIGGNSQNTMIINANAESNIQLVNDVQYQEPDVPMK